MASINPRLIKAAVKIRDPLDKINGTAFLVSRPDRYDPKAKDFRTPMDGEPWRGWYVTCAHVIDGIEAVQPDSKPRAVIELNEIDQSDSEGGKLQISCPVARRWFRHNEWEERCLIEGPIDARYYTDEDVAVDVAVSPYYFDGRYMDKTDWWGYPPRLFLTKSEMVANTEDEQPLNEGDEIFTVGFPVGFQNDVKNWPAVRQGVVAQIQPYLRGTAQFFLVDASVFGGNSGGPVVTKPQPMGIKGTRWLKRNSLIGMVSGHKVNPNTGENADLGMVIPLDTINETIDMALKKLSQTPSDI